MLDRVCQPIPLISTIPSPPPSSTHPSAILFSSPFPPLPHTSSVITFGRFRDFFLLLPANGLLVDYWLAAGRCPDLDTRVQYRDSQDATRASPWGEWAAGAVCLLAIGDDKLPSVQSLSSHNSSSSKTLWPLPPIRCLS